jgi:large subunit ribosomal protein L18
MCVHKSNRNINVQLVDDVENKTLCSVSTLSGALKGKLKGSCRKGTACGTALGEEIAKAASSKGIKKVVFDRGGYRYHGVVKAIAEAARKNGLEF